MWREGREKAERNRDTTQTQELEETNREVTV